MESKRIILGIMLIVAILGGGIIWLKIGNSHMIIGQYHEYKEANSYTVSDGVNNLDLEKMKINDYLIIYDEKDILSIKIKDNISKTLDYTKKPYTIQEVSSCNEFDSDVEGIIICTESLDSINKFEEILEYVKQGGGLMLAIRPVEGDIYNKYSREFGIIGDNSFKEEIGIKLDSNIIIQAKGFQMEDTAIINSLLDLQVSEDVKVHASVPSGTALIWETNLDEGKIVFVNGTFFDDKGSRGIIVGAIGCMSDNFIYPIINAGVMFIDDFPAEIPEMKMNDLYKGLDLNVEQFYKEIWWPDMIKLSNKYGFKYTGLFVQSYKDTITAPFEGINDRLKGNFIYFTSELINQGGELGYHGINHQPYTYSQEEADVENYKAWKSKEDVKESWRVFDENIDMMLPNYDIRVYVPPSNILSQEIREQFPEVAPNVKMISGIYNTGGELGEYEQEYEVAEDGIIEFPRISSAYISDPSNKWNVYNGISMYGVFAHFIHPDDILDPERSGGKVWEDQMDSFMHNLDDTIGRYKWLNMMTATEAGEELKKFNDAKVYLDEGDNYIKGYINNFRKNMYFILRTNKRIDNTIDCDYMQIDEDVYWIYTESPRFTIEVIGGK